MDTDQALSDALALASAETPLVVQIRGDAPFAIPLQVADGAEVAVLGSGEVSLRGSGDFAVSVGAESTLYLSNVSVRGAGATGVRCMGSALWFDDGWVAESADSGIRIGAACVAHVRRAILIDNAGSGLVLDGALARVSLRNTAVVGNGAGAQPGLSVRRGELSLRYATVANNRGAAGDSMVCAGATSGEVRNSVIVGAQADSIDCSTLSFSRNATDQSELGGDNVLLQPESIGVWFVELEAGDLHLTPDGEMALRDLAKWSEGDPRLDIDGDAIELEGESYPGLDQPLPGG